MIESLIEKINAFAKKEDKKLIITLFLMLGSSLGFNIREYIANEAKESKQEKPCIEIKEEEERNDFDWGLEETLHEKLDDPDV